MTEAINNNQARTVDAVKHAETAYSSNDVRLAWRGWLIVAAIVLPALLAVPWAWQQREPLPDGADRRVPYDLSNDYWLFARYCRAALADERSTLVLGDSVVWGHYVRDDQTLSHGLNALAAARQGSPKSAERFANLGVDGIHPAAMEGLLDHYAGGIRGRNVVLHCNLLWMSSDRHDLPHEAFAQHLRVAYLDRQDLPAWTIAHPDGCPLEALARPLPSGSPLPHDISPADCVPWRKRGIEPFSPQWVELDKSLQWSCFRRTLERLRDAGNRVFVLVGPFNEHMLEDDSRNVYRQRLAAVSAYLTGAGVPYYVPKPLDSDLYADASHPLAAGYAELARQLYQYEAFARRGERSGAVPAVGPPKGETR